MGKFDEDQLNYLLPKAVAWAEEWAAIIQDEGTPLGNTFYTLAMLADVKQFDQVRLKYVPVLPELNDEELRQAAAELGYKPSTRDGLTFGHSILIRQDKSEDIELFVHELIHVRQHEFLGGLPPFVARYLHELNENGYWNAPLEEEARREANRICRLFRE